MWKPTGMYRDELRQKHPATALKADHEASHASRIKMFCRECMQQTSAADCPDNGCFLFPSRPGADHTDANVRTADSVPSVEQYAEWIRAKDPDGSKAAAARERFAAHRAKGEDDDGDGEYQEV